MAFSPRIYDHWKLALLSYFAASTAESVLRILNPRYPLPAVTLIAELALALASFPGFLYIFGEFVRLLGGKDKSSRRLVRILVVGFLAFWACGVAIPNSYNIASDAFRVTLPYPTILRYLLDGGDLAGKLAMGLGAVFARGVGPTDILESEPERAASIREWVSEALAPIGFVTLMIGFVIGFGFLAFAAFLVIIPGAILLSIGLIVRWSTARSES